MALTPQAQSLLDMVYRVGAPRFHDLSVAQARHSFQKLQYAFGTAAQAVGAVTEVPMARADGSALFARLYRPRDSAPDAMLPLLIYFHGGGWCIGDVESYDGLCRALANASACAVLSVDYRLAPEHPFPAAVDDARFALEWAVEHADLLGIDAGRIVLGGDSAGGNLAIVTALAARDGGRPELQPKQLVLIYPSTEIASTRPSRERYAEGYFLDRASLLWFFERYLPGGEVDDWQASPMRAASLAGLPPMQLITAECDPLVDDCVAFAARVQEEGGEVALRQVEGMIHGFLTLGRLFPEADAVVAEIGAALRSRFASVASAA